MPFIGSAIWFLTAIVVFASLNRETALFIPLALLVTMDTKIYQKTGGGFKLHLERWLISVGLLAVWAVIFFGLRSLVGSASHIETIEGLWALNTTTAGLFYAFLHGALFLGGLWVFAVLGFKQAPRFVWQVAVIIPFYIITVMVWGVWKEVRLLMPLYPVLVPLALS